MMRMSFLLSVAFLVCLLDHGIVRGQTIVTFQTAAPAGSLIFEAEQEWADNIARMTGGDVVVDLLPVNAVVGYDETLFAVGRGILDGHITEPSYFAGHDPAFALLGNLVGAWETPYDALEFMVNAGGDDLLRELLAGYGLHMIGSAVTGVESLVSNVPIRTIDDLAGLRLRAPEGLVHDVFSRAGASPVVLPFSEVVTSLDNGVIDAADFTVFSVNHASGMHDIARHPVHPGFHSVPIVDVSMNRALWETLDPQVQAVFEVATRDLALSMPLALAAADTIALADARRNGIELHSWSAADRRLFRTIARDAWQALAERSPMAGRVYEQAVAFLTETGRLTP